jgi:hypothetical protein
MSQTQKYLEKHDKEKTDLVKHCAKDLLKNSGYGKLTNLYYYFDEDDEFDEDFREVVCDILNHRISKMTKSEAQSALYDIIESAPEWMLRDFVNNWI